MQIGRLAAEQATEPVMAGEGEVSEEAERLGVQRRPRVEDGEGRDSSRLPCPQEVLSTERERAPWRWRWSCQCEAPLRRAA